MYIAMMTKERSFKIVNFSTSCASAWFMVDELSRVGFLVQGFGHIGDIFKNRLDIGPTNWVMTVSYTHLRAHETSLHLVCRLLLEKTTCV